MKVVIERDGRSREVSGWRKWAIAIPVVTIVALTVACAVVFVLGLALTLGVILMIAIPTALILALIAFMLGGLHTKQASSDGPSSLEPWDSLK